MTSNPLAVKEIYRALRESKRGAPLPSAPDLIRFGVENLRGSLALIIEYAAQQGLIPRQFAVDELFDDVARQLQ